MSERESKGTGAFKMWLSFVHDLNTRDARRLSTEGSHECSSARAATGKRPHPRLYPVAGAESSKASVSCLPPLYRYACVRSSLLPSLALSSRRHCADSRLHFCSHMMHASLFADMESVYEDRVDYDELAACLSEPSRADEPLPPASDMLRRSGSSSFSLAAVALRPSLTASPVAVKSARQVELVAPYPIGTSDVEPSTAPPSPTPSLAGSRLASRWLKGIAAREALQETKPEEQTASFLDLTALGDPSTNISPSSITADYRPWEQNPPPSM